MGVRSRIKNFLSKYMRSITFNQRQKYAWSKFIKALIVLVMGLTSWYGSYQMVLLMSFLSILIAIPLFIAGLALISMGGIGVIQAIKHFMGRQYNEE